MKVIVLTDHFGNGGAERVASLVINGISKFKSNEVHVCIFQDIINYNLSTENVYLHILADSQKGHLVNAWLKIRNLARVIKTVNPDAIYSFGPIMASYVFLAKKLSGVKKLKVISSERNDPRYEPVQSWKKKVRNFCYNRSDILVCQTPMAVDLLEHLYGVSARKQIIPNPISTGLPEWKGINSSNIITAARLTEQKNLPMLIDAFDMLAKKHAEMQLVIYGEGELHSFLEDYILQKGLESKISLKGFAKDIHKIMAESYMYVSSSNYEGISNSMLEAMGIGLPCVCTDCPVGGAGMVISQGENGFLTPVGDTNALFEAMCRLVEDKSLADKFSKSSRYVNQKFSLDKITGEWIQLL